MSDYAETFDMSQFVDRYAERVIRRIDAAVLKRVEADLARYGYVKVVRCRDCEYLNVVGKCPCGFHALEDLDGFCKWGKKKEGDE